MKLDFLLVLSSAIYLPLITKFTSALLQSLQSAKSIERGFIHCTKVNSISPGIIKRKLLFWKMTPRWVTLSVIWSLVRSYNNQETWSCFCPCWIIPNIYHPYIQILHWLDCMDKWRTFKLVSVTIVNTWSVFYWLVPI